MNLREANICLDCDEIFDSKELQCPACSSVNAITLSKWVQPLPQQRVLDKSPKKSKRKRSKIDFSGKEANVRSCTA